MKSVLITGINGLLGSAIYRFLKNKQFKIAGIGTRPFPALNVRKYYCGDIADEKFIDSIKQSFDYIIHAAAITNLQTCEDFPQRAYQVHVQGSSNVAKLSKNHSKTALIYISTDSVFDGLDNLYTEQSIPNPLNTYSKTKLLGEQAIIEKLENNYILRLNLYGFTFPLQNSLFEWAFKHLSVGEQIKGYKNVFFNPLYTIQIAQLIHIIIDQKMPFGFYNLSSNEAISKFDFLKEICRIFNFNENLILPIDANFENDQLQRPYNTSLDNKKIRQFIDSSNFDLGNGLELLKKDMNEYN